MSEEEYKSKLKELEFRYHALEEFCGFSGEEVARLKRLATFMDCMEMRLLHVDYIVSKFTFEHCKSKVDLETFCKRELATKFAEQLYKDNILQYEAEPYNSIGDVILRCDLYVLNKRKNE